MVKAEWSDSQLVMWALGTIFLARLQSCKVIWFELANWMTQLVMWVTSLPVRLPVRQVGVVPDVGNFLDLARQGDTILGQFSCQFDVTWRRVFLILPSGDLNIDLALRFRFRMDNFIWTDYTALCDVAQFERRGAFFFTRFTGSGGLTTGLTPACFSYILTFLQQLADAFWHSFTSAQQQSASPVNRLAKLGRKWFCNIKMTALYHMVQ